MTVKKNSLSCDSRYIWYGSRYVLFRLLSGSSLAVFPGFLNVYFFFFFPIQHVFSCLLAWWLNNNLTESEENTCLCTCACLVLFDSWLTAYLKDFFSLSSYTLSSYTTLHLYMLMFFWHNVALVLFFCVERAIKEKHSVRLLQNVLASLLRPCANSVQPQSKSGYAISTVSATSLKHSTIWAAI